MLRETSTYSEASRKLRKIYEMWRDPGVFEWSWDLESRIKYGASLYNLVISGNDERIEIKALFGEHGKNNIRWL